MAEWVHESVIVV